MSLLRTLVDTFLDHFNYLNKTGPRAGKRDSWKPFYWRNNENLTLKLEQIAIALTGKLNSANEFKASENCPYSWFMEAVMASVSEAYGERLKLGVGDESHKKVSSKKI